MTRRTGSKPEALVLAGLGTNGYGILRSLGRQGVAVVGTTDRRSDAGRFSRYCTRCYVYSSGISDPGGFFYSSKLSDYEALCTLLLQWRSDFESNPVLFPTGDQFAFLLANFREQLSPHYEYHWVPAELHSRIVNKDQMSIVCQQAGVLIPRTHITSSEEDLWESVHKFSFPCILKPIQRFIEGFPVDRKNFIARSPAELFDFYTRYPGLQGKTIWQEIIEGGDENNFQCTLLVQESGEPAGVFCTRKIHQYPAYGVMSYGRSEWNDVVVSQALKLVRFLGYRGIASIEFKYNPRDGRYYMLEMNARWPRSNGYFPRAGLNLQYQTYLDLTGGSDERAFQTRQRNGVHWINVLEEAKRYWETREPFPLALLGWVRTVLRADTYAFWDWRDPLPFVVACLRMFRQGIRKLLRNSRILLTKHSEAA